MFGRNKRLSKNDIKCIVLILDDFNNKHSELTNTQKEYFLASTLEQFGVKTDSGYSYGCIPPPPSQCYTSINDVTTKPPTEE